jgi:hypothetical protein
MGYIYNLNSSPPVPNEAAYRIPIPNFRNDHTLGKDGPK